MGFGEVGRGGPGWRLLGEFFTDTGSFDPAGKSVSLSEGVAKVLARVGATGLAVGVSAKGKYRLKTSGRPGVSGTIWLQRTAKSWRVSKAAACSACRFDFPVARA